MAIIPGDAGKNIIIDTPERQKSRKMLYLLGFVALAAAAVLYFGFGSGGQLTTGVSSTNENTLSLAEQQQIDSTNKMLESLKTISLGSVIFSDKKFQSLVASDKLPIAIGEKGRVNPFEAF
ncbi:MAG TPA: hypothetical protein P5089_01680 [Candidatus Portnoybacteria bacterium]|nr:hypothetical protein [Candidatus Portnoybacteria bacterium]